MNCMGIIATEYHVVDAHGMSCGIHGIIYRYHTWHYPWYQSWMQRVMRSTYCMCGIYVICENIRK